MMFEAAGNGSKSNVTAQQGILCYYYRILFRLSNQGRGVREHRELGG